MPRETKRTMTLECILTDTERLSYGKELSEEYAHRNETEAALSSVSKQMKATIAEHDAHIATLANKLNAGREYRMVDCDVEYDWGEGIKKVTRKDTGATVKVEQIPDHERQEQLKLEEEEALAAEAEAKEQETEQQAEAEQEPVAQEASANADND